MRVRRRASPSPDGSGGRAAGVSSGIFWYVFTEAPRRGPRCSGAVRTGSGPDHTAVVLGDDDGGGSRRFEAVVLGPGAWPTLAGVLDVGEHRALVRGGDDAGDLGAEHSGEEALDLGCSLCVGDVGVRGEHLVVGAGRLRAVGLDPDTAVGIDPNPVG